MIKSLSLLVRKEGLTHEQFVEHWVNVHAPLARAVPGLRRYVLTHVLAERSLERRCFGGMGGAARRTAGVVDPDLQGLGHDGIGSRG